MKWIAGVEKFVATLLVGVSSWGIAAIHDGHVSGPEWFGLVGAIGAALTAYAVPNTPAGD